MTTEQYFKLSQDPTKLRVCFVRELSGKTQPEYTFYIFSHVYLYLPNKGLIWETTRPMGTTGFSQDAYHDLSSVEVATDVDTLLAYESLTKSPHYGSCAIAVSRELSKLSMDIGNQETPDGVFFAITDKIGRYTNCKELYQTLKDQLRGDGNHEAID